MDTIVRSGVWNFSLFLTWLASVISQCDYYQNLVPGTTYYVSSPSYPVSYPPGSSCRWYAESPANTGIVLDCYNFRLPPSDGCQGDRLAVSSTGDLSMTDAYRYCGSGSFVQQSASNRLNVVLVSGRFSPGGAFSCSILVSGAAQVTTPPPSPSQCDCGWTQKTRIVGGNETAPNEYPMMAGLVDGALRIVYCGATIISSRTVLTAAHCLSKKSVDLVGVLVGDFDLLSGSDTTAAQLVLAESFSIHPDYVAETQVNDIALVRVVKDFTFSKDVGPVCLPIRFREQSFVGASVVVLGWGTTAFGGPTSPRLRQTQLDIVSNADCAKALTADTITAENICTFYVNRDSCQFDSGGPVMWQDVQTGRYHLVGIISYGVGCASDTPGVNTRVTSYLDWIQQATNEIYCVV